MSISYGNSVPFKRWLWCISLAIYWQMVLSWTKSRSIHKNCEIRNSFGIGIKWLQKMDRDSCYVALVLFTRERDLGVRTGVWEWLASLSTTYYTRYEGVMYSVLLFFFVYTFWCYISMMFTSIVRNMRHRLDPVCGTRYLYQFGSDAPYLYYIYSYFVYGSLKWVPSWHTNNFLQNIVPDGKSFRFSGVLNKDLDIRRRKAPFTKLSQKPWCNPNHFPIGCEFCCTFVKRRHSLFFWLRTAIAMRKFLIYSARPGNSRSYEMK